MLILATLLVGLVLLGSREKGVSVADASVPDTEISASLSVNFSPTASIAITMYAVDDD